MVGRVYRGMFSVVGHGRIEEKRQLATKKEGRFGGVWRRGERARRGRTGDEKDEMRRREDRELDS